MNGSEKLSLISRLHNSPNAQRVLFILAIIYIIAPTDLIPDVPVVGWLDDLGILLAEIVQYMIYVKNRKADYQKVMNNNQTDNKADDKNTIDEEKK